MGLDEGVPADLEPAVDEPLGELTTRFCMTPKLASNRSRVLRVGQAFDVVEHPIAGMHFQAHADLRLQQKLQGSGIRSSRSR